MKRASPIVVSVAVLLLALAGPLLANEMQRLIFNAAGNIGVVIVIIENQGITPENSPGIRTNLGTASTQLNQVAAMYQDPPFEVKTITPLPPKLENFFQATEGMNRARRMYHLSGVYSNLKSAMTLAYNSRRGTYYCATCDTFVVDLGHFLGQAYSASRLNDAQTLSMARSRVNLAISEGIKASGALGCGFPSLALWQGLGIQNARTTADWERIVKGAERLVAEAQGLASAVTIPSTTRQRQGTHALAGTYGLRGEYVVSLENGKLVGRQTKAYGLVTPRNPADIVVFELNAVAEPGGFIENNPSGLAYRGRWRLNLNMPWWDCYAFVRDVFGEPRKWFSLDLHMSILQPDGRWRSRNYYPKLIDPNRPPNQ